MDCPFVSDSRTVPAGDHTHPRTSDRAATTATNRRLLTAVWIVLLTTATSSLAAQTPPAASQSRLEVADATHDLGDLLWGSTVVTTFSVENRSDSSISIDKVLPGCGCMSVVSFDATVPARESGSITIQLETGKLQAGPSTKICVVKVSDAGQPLKLITKFDVRPLFDMPPLPLQLKALPDRPGEVSFDLTPITDPPAKLLRVETVFDIATAELEKLDSGASRITVRVPATSKVGVVPENVRIYLKHPQIAAGAEVPVEVALGIVFQDRIQQSAPSVTFRRNETTQHLESGDAPLRRTVTLKTDLPGYNFRLLDAQLKKAPEGAFSVEVEEVEAGRHYAIHVTLLKVKRGAAVARGVLFLTTDDQYKAVRKVTVIAQFPRS